MTTGTVVQARVICKQVRARQGQHAQTSTKRLASREQARDDRGRPGGGREGGALNRTRQNHTYPPDYPPVLPSLSSSRPLPYFWEQRKYATTTAAATMLRHSWDKAMGHPNLGRGKTSYVTDMVLDSRKKKKFRSQKKVSSTHATDLKKLALSKKKKKKRRPLRNSVNLTISLFFVFLLYICWLSFVFKHFRKVRVRRGPAGRWVAILSAAELPPWRSLSCDLNAIIYIHTYIISFLSKRLWLADLEGKVS